MQTIQGAEHGRFFAEFVRQILIVILPESFGIHPSDAIFVKSGMSLQFFILAILMKKLFYIFDPEKESPLLVLVLLFVLTLFDPG